MVIIKQGFWIKWSEMKKKKKKKKIFWACADIHRQSITTEHYHNCTVNYYILLNTHTILQKTIINSWTHTQLHRKSLYTTEHAHNYTDNHYKQLSTHTMPPTIIINYWTRTQFHRHLLYSTEYDRNSNGNQIKLLNSHNSNGNHYMLLNTQIILKANKLTYLPRTQFHRHLI